MKYLQTTSILLTLIAAISLTGCGGGGSSPESYVDTGTDNFNSETNSSTNNTNNSQESSEESSNDLAQPTARSYDVSITWDIPTQRTNGRSLELSEIDGYEIEIQKAGESETTTKYVDSPTRSRKIVDGLEPGEYTFKIAAVDTNGLYSEYTQVTANLN